MRRARGAGLLVTAALGSSLALASPASAADPEVVTGIASVTPSFGSANAAATTVRAAAGGRFIAFTSKATNLVSGTSGGMTRVYLRDTWTDTTTLVSRTSAGAPSSTHPANLGAVSPDGAWVVFSTEQAMVPTDTNGVGDVYLWRRSTGAIELVSRTHAGGLGNGHSGTAMGDFKADVSDDGRYVFFSSAATNLTAVADLNSKVDVFRRDRTAGTTMLVSSNGAAQGNGDSYEVDASGNGRYATFSTLTTNFPGTDTNGVADIWFRDLNGATLQKVSVGLDSDANGASSQPSISDDGDFIVFQSSATDLVNSDTNGNPDVFFRRRSTSLTNRLSTSSGSFAQLPGGGFDPSMTPDGTRIGFQTLSPASGADTNGTVDLYVRESGTTRLVSLRSSGAQQAQPTIATSVASNLVAWSTEDKATANDGNATADVFFRHTPFLGPFATIDAFVPFQVRRFTGVTPTASQTLAARNRLRAGGSPYTFIMGLADAPSFSDKRAPVIRLYWAYFKRRPDLGGLNFWLNRYRNGARLVDISQEFAKSSEFRNKYGNTSPEQFVTLVYQNVLERNPDAAGLSFWANRIRNGTPRGQVMTNFSESSEGRRVIGPRSDTILVALGMYGKIPTATLFNAIVADRQAGFPREIIPIYILGAPEYAATL